MGDNALNTFEEALNLENEYDFKAAKKVYEDLTANEKQGNVFEKATSRLADMDDLIEEKNIYERVHHNAIKVLSNIGMNISESQELMDILMEADAIDFENETALFIPVKESYINECLEKCPRTWPGDPGLNTFGTGATPPFLKRLFDDELRQANRKEFEKIVNCVSENQDVVKIFSLPVETDKSITAFERAQFMENAFPGLKMTATKGFSDEEMKFLAGKDDWVDGTSLITSLVPMSTMIKPFLRSARSGANLLLLDLTIAGSSGPGSPEALLTQIHAQVLFMIVMSQSVNPGVFCMHGGIPGVTEAGGDLSYSSTHQPLINAAMARVNNWVTKLPSAQSGGSTSISTLNNESVFESELSRNTLRKYGVHIVRHAMGAMGSLNFFSLEKFEEDCQRERKNLTLFKDAPSDKGVIPLYFPTDSDAMDGIREIAEKGGPKNAEHTLRNVDAFIKWEERVNSAAREKLYFPDINDTVIEKITRGDMIP
ncbi:Trimethylamine:corrinoid methyltransferase-like protein [Desulfamplus magnetovallimortis]|uniref:Trimethylamine:corrinoid methyltransferase-like protein n=1 Tax=Desulfamplus magnetovallimortis TaxID=1246637 RepID=A0A1W1HC20_9BACT|nr:trimethylamine methyltransferase family protein [Desulfamplus magnetovallimortis]SLM30030.1 Trimethylamine:corrinoid methyltransferase-like protein [Desulfamplus magnetovallimortis]